MPTVPSNNVSRWRVDVQHHPGVPAIPSSGRPVSASLASGNTLSTFQFDKGDHAVQNEREREFWQRVWPVVRSFVYIGAALTDPGFQFDPNNELQLSREPRVAITLISWLWICLLRGTTIRWRLGIGA